MRLLIYFLSMFVFLSFASASPAAGEVKLLTVHDGDTITVEPKSGKKYKIRLYCIDAPELAQPYGKESRDYLALLLKDKKITVRKEGSDNYGRKIATVYAGGNNVNLQMVRDGYAWHYKQYHKSAEMAKAQEYARRKGLGLWRQNNPKEPWVYRREARGNENANNKPLIKSPVEGVVICFNPENYKISFRTENCPKGYITVMK